MNKYEIKLMEYLDLICFFILVTLKLMVYGRQLENEYFSYSALLVPILSSILILISFSILFSNKTRSKFLYFSNVIITILIIGDTNYFRYFKDVISLLVLKNGIMLQDVGASVENIFKPVDLLYALDLLILPIINHLRVNKSNNLKPLVKFACFFVLLLAGASVDGMKIYALSKDQPRLLSTMFNKVYISKQLGCLNYHGIDLFNTLSNEVDRKKPLAKSEETEIENFLQSNSQSQGVNMKGIAKGKNVIMIQVEALQQFVINSTIDGKEITPNLNKWIKRSSYFDNFYYQVAAGGTSDAEFMVNNSLFPAQSGAAYLLYSGNDFDSLGKSLSSEGYSTAAMHGYKETFWNRNNMYKSEGFDKFYNENDYNIDDNVGLGLSDKSFLNQSLEKIKSLQSPYFTFLITLSSHFPYDDVKNYGDFSVGQFNDTLLGNYLKAIHYTDEALGSFLNNLEAEGILKDSIVVLYGDHYAIPKEQESELSTFLNINDMDDVKWQELQKVPLMLHFPNDGYKGIIHTNSGQMDLYPTLCNLLDLPKNNMLGSDLYNTKVGNVIFRNGSFINGDVYYNSQTDTYYNMSSGERLESTDLTKDIKDQAEMRLEYSDEILNHNLLKKNDN